MKASLALGLSLLTAVSLRAADIKWLHRDYDFGLMKEIAGPKTGTSSFINVGQDTISIVNVRPSCGCTSADFSDAPIAPGDTAVFTYTYDPAMRPGKFMKTVRVKLSDGTSQSVKISGNVLGTPESLATLYPVEGGVFRLSDAVLDLGTVTYGRSPITFVNAYSMSLDSVYTYATAHNPAVVIKQSARKAGPGDIVTYSINFDSRKHNVYGPVEIPVTVYAGDSDSATVALRAFVVPDAEYLTLHQNGRTPVCEVIPGPVELGMNLTRDGKPVTTKIQINNSGNGPLTPLRICTKSPAVTIGKLPKAIKNGKSARIEIKTDLSMLDPGPFRIPIDIITDDPVHPHIVVDIVGSVR